MDWHEVIGYVMAIIMAIIALFREDKFAANIQAILHKPHHPDDLKKLEELEELKRERDITKAFMEMIDDDELVIKYKTLQRVMRKHGKIE